MESLDPELSTRIEDITRKMLCTGTGVVKEEFEFEVEKEQLKLKPGRIVIKDPVDKSQFYTIDPSYFKDFNRGIDLGQKEALSTAYIGDFASPLSAVKYTTATEIAREAENRTPYYCKCNYPEYKLKLMKYRIKFFLLKNPDYEKTHCLEGAKCCCTFNHLKSKGLIK